MPRLLSGAKHEYNAVALTNIIWQDKNKYSFRFKIVLFIQNISNTLNNKVFKGKDYLFHQKHVQGLTFVFTKHIF